MGHSAVVYTDGSGGINNGKSGTYGFFYYIYKDVEVNYTNLEEQKEIQEKNKKQLSLVSFKYTDKGILDLNEYQTGKMYSVQYNGLYENFNVVAPQYVYGGREYREEPYVHDGVTHNVTNNLMEIKAILDSVKHLLSVVKEKDLTLTNILVKSDSETSMKRLDSISQGKCDNIPYGLELFDLIKEMEKLGINFKYNYVKAHATSFGNKIVDKLALSAFQKATPLHEVVDLTKVVSRKVYLPWYMGRSKLHLLHSGDINRPYMFLDGYDSKIKVGEKRGGNLVAVIKPTKDLGEPLLSMYKKYLEKGDDSVLDIKIDLARLKDPDVNILYSVAKEDIFIPNANNNRWFKVCNDGAVMAGGTLSGIAVNMYTKGEMLLDRRIHNDGIYIVDIKDEMKNHTFKDREQAEIKIDLTNAEEICGVKVDDELRKSLARINKYKIYPRLNAPDANVIHNILIEDKDCKFELIIKSITENVMTVYLYIESEVLGIQSVWLDNNSETIFLK